MAAAIAAQIPVAPGPDRAPTLVAAVVDARPALLTANGVELREQLRVVHQRFAGPGTIVRVVPELPGAVVRWDEEIAEPARTVIAVPEELTAIGLGREIVAHLQALFAALEPEPA